MDDDVAVAVLGRFRSGCEEVLAVDDEDDDDDSSKYGENAAGLVVFTGTHEEEEEFAAFVDVDVELPFQRSWGIFRRRS